MKNLIIAMLRQLGTSAMDAGWALLEKCNEWENGQ